MKNVLFLIVLFSFSAFAELKPEWSIVPTQCGENTEIVSNNSPLRACIASVTGQKDLSVVYFEYEDEKKYFLITDSIVRMGATTLVLEEVSVSNNGRYTFLNDLVDGGETHNVSQMFGFAGMILDGNGFNGTLQIVLTTLSL